jgi:hypothetical protein
MTSVELVLVAIEEWPWSALWRIFLGLAIVPVFHSLTGADQSVYVHLALFIALLATLRVVPALLRFALPLSAEAKAIWKKRRFIAKRYDSYQWQKLFWIGLGMLPYAIAGRGLKSGEMAIAAFCLVGGALGLLAWHRTRET